ncbi:MAG TPA: 3-hydroxyacyl-CoA dehydrogenase [Ureibacillus sp.]|nr:3-hydroxyacyl-CoA dehydrogenase [Ureibacillus sp.]
MEFKKIVVAGSGVLGSQIAFQTAFKGYDVAVYDINDEAIDSGKNRLMNLKVRYQQDLGATEEEVNLAYNRMSFHKDLGEAVLDADFVIEAVPEVEEIKKAFYQQLRQVAPEKTIFATNSSTMIPSQFAEVTGRPHKFLALHFANEIWLNNTAEIMKHPNTEKEVFNAIIEFAKSIGMFALPIQREQPGYILNSLLVPFLEAAQMLLVKKIADVETIDKTWMIATGAPKGPFAILDIVGINTAYNIANSKAEAGNEEFKKLANVLKSEYIDKGKLGTGTKQGFYSYPNPSYLEPGFLES